MKTKQEISEQLTQYWKDQKEMLYKKLKPFHVRLVYNRLFNTMSFNELGVRYEMNSLSSKMLFDWCVKKIREEVDRDLAKAIESYHAFINAKEQRDNKTK